MKKLNWKNIWLALMLVVMIGIIVSDGITLLRGASFTWLGVFTEVLMILFSDMIIEHFQDIVRG